MCSADLTLSRLTVQQMYNIYSIIKLYIVTIIVVDKMDSLNGATLIKADGSKVEAAKALENKVRPSLSLEVWSRSPVLTFIFLGPRPLLLLCPLVSALPAVHPHAE